LKCVAAPIGFLGFVTDRVPQRHLNNLVGVTGLFLGPRFERCAKSMR
jgi:hypothetical protein